MYSLTDLRLEAQAALEKIWFVQSWEEMEDTDSALSVRLYIRPKLFVQIFVGELTGSLYLALIEGRRRIFGIDLEAGQWHLHPYSDPDKHEPLPEGLGPKPLLKFLVKVEDLLLQFGLL